MTAEQPHVLELADLTSAQQTVIRALLAQGNHQAAAIVPTAQNHQAQVSTLAVELHRKPSPPVTTARARTGR